MPRDRAVRDKSIDLAERDEIADLLGLDRQSDEARFWVAAICKRVDEYWREVGVNKDIVDALLLAAGKVGRRGRRASISERYCAYFLGLIFVNLTLKDITNYRGHPFYRLLQICLRKGDPMQLMGQLKRHHPDLTVKAVLLKRRRERLHRRNLARAAFTEGWRRGWLPD